MSCDKWFYDPDICDGQACPGDCDLCDIPKNTEEYGAEEDEMIQGKVTGEHAGVEYISVDDAVEAIASRDETNGTVPKFTGKEVCEVIKGIPTTDVAGILEHSKIVGYTFKELCMFAEACKMQDISEDDLKNFCTAADSAARYTIDKIVEAFEENVLDELTRATVDDDIMDESEDEQ